ncbi:MAG: dihydrolipoyl dehydrogenase [Treponema sp.]|jgi:dihydrolipoamide dehydrogenase|nr:dihydrolipoyl dehydrogenase [Treponema sp.]
MEIIVIGGGPGGYAAALYAAKRGIKVTLVEKAEIGGVCLNRGCIPTKTILHSAKLLHHAKSFASLGINASVEGVDYARLSARREEVVSRLRNGVSFLLQKAGVNVINGTASFMNAGKLRVNSEEKEMILSADKILIAAGAIPVAIPVAVIDGQNIITSDHVLALNELPQSMAIIGGGVIGCEFAQAFARLGCEVMVIEAAPRLLPGMDADISALLRKTLEKDGVKIYLDSEVTEAVKTSKGILVKFRHEQKKGIELSAEKLLVAVGRKPELSNMHLDNVGVDCTGGFIGVDDHMQTNISGIYAVGDVTNGVRLAHVASYGGIAAVKHMLGEKADSAAGLCIPMCVYTDPEIACTGLTFDAAKDAGYNCREGVFPLSANSRAVIENSTDGFAKMILDSDGTIIGAHLIGQNVTEMISLLGALINVQTAASDLEQIIFTHPSVSEIISESVFAADKMALHIPQEPVGFV